jgi:hypothetical protein
MRAVPAYLDASIDGVAGTFGTGVSQSGLAAAQWLYRLEQLDEWEQRLAVGEQVSGPAADTYRHRVHAAHEKFAGRVLTSVRQARDLLANPLLQIFPGRAMTCVLDPNKALCQLFGDDDPRRTPDQDDCRPQCKNLAFTDANIAELQARARRLRELTTDPLAPSIRRDRERHELARIDSIIRRHHHGK